jgi:hypothetical protein
VVKGNVAKVQRYVIHSRESSTNFLKVVVLVVV